MIWFMPNAHIIPTDDRWNVKQENGDVVSTHDTQTDAEQAAKEWPTAAKSLPIETRATSPAFAKATLSDWTAAAGRGT